MKTAATENTVLDRSVEQRVRVEQIKTLYNSIASLVLINLVVSVTLVFIFWDWVSHGQLIAWMAAMLIMLAARIAIYRFFSAGFKPQQLLRYQTFLILGSLSAGIIWGIGGLIMFVPDRFDYQIFIIASLLAMTGGSAFSLSIYLPAFYSFAPLALLPMAIYVLASGDTTLTALAVIILTFLLGLTLFNRTINKNLTNAMALRYENLDLIQELEAQTHKADQANRAKSKFLAAASHDLRQPLYALTLFTAALEEKTVDEDGRRITGQIAQSVDALQSLFDALLDISVLDAGTAEVNIGPVNLDDLLAKLAHEFNPLAKEKRLSIRWPESHGYVSSDRNLLEQILRNLLSNAVRYTREGQIEVSCLTHQDSITVNVTDTGVGISQDDQEIIFEEFHQVDNSERDRQKGLGLGLSIVQRAANLLGHEITVSSQPDAGSTFSITVAKSQDPVPSPANGVAQAVGSDIEEQLFILVIDDEASIREGLQQLLEIWGCAVACASDEDEAVAHLEQCGRTPDAIISDYRLRDNRSGLDAIASINAAFHSDIPALIVTGDTRQDKLTELNAAGYHVLHKPVPPAKLRAFLRGLS